MNAKTWNKVVIGILVSLLLSFSAVTVIIDPYFHYHYPLENFFYHIWYERYQNDGIIKHFDYNMLITGTSMAENFKSSECDKLFGGGVKTIKVPSSGGTYKEIDMWVRKAAQSNGKLKYVLRVLDYNNRIMDKDEMRQDYKYPYYLYNKNILDDINYFFNKEVFFNDTLRVISTYENNTGIRYTNFDDYANWNNGFVYGKESVISSFARKEQKVEREIGLSDKERELLLNNIKQNVTNVAQLYPDITFYYFFPPYSICYWDNDIYREGKLYWWLETEKITIEELLKYDNIRLFSFTDNLELITDLDNYKDRIHYSGEINSKILRWISEGKYELTQKNYKEYLEKIEQNFSNYDYDSIYGF